MNYHDEQQLLVHALAKSESYSMALRMLAIFSLHYFSNQSIQFLMTSLLSMKLLMSAKNSVCFLEARGSNSSGCSQSSSFFISSSFQWQSVLAVKFLQLHTCSFYILIMFHTNLRDIYSIAAPYMRRQGRYSRAKIIWDERVIIQPALKIKLAAIIKQYWQLWKAKNSLRQGLRIPNSNSPQSYLRSTQQLQSRIGQMNITHTNIILSNDPEKQETNNKKMLRTHLTTKNISIVPRNFQFSQATLNDCSSRQLNIIIPKIYPLTNKLEQLSGSRLFSPAQQQIVQNKSDAGTIMEMNCSVVQMMQKWTPVIGESIVQSKILKRKRRPR